MSDDNNLNINTVATSAIDSLDPVAKAKLVYLTEKSMMEMENERWKARRWMAWVSMISLIALTGCLLFAVKPSALGALSDVITWSYIAFSAVVGTYMGTSALSYMAAVKNGAAMKTLSARDAIIAGMKTPFDNIEKKS